MAYCTAPCLGNTQLPTGVCGLTIWCDKGPGHAGLTSCIGEGGSVETCGGCIEGSDDELVGELSVPQYILVTWVYDLRDGG